MGNKLLLYRRGGLGDTLLTFPLAEIFKNLGWEVHFVGNTDYLRLGKEAGFIDRYFSESPPPEGYGKIVLLSAERFLDDPRVVWLKPFPSKREHVTTYYLKGLGIYGSPFSETLPIKPLPDWEGKVVLHPGSGSPKKNAPLGLFKEVYRLLEERGERPLMVLGEAEYHLLGELKGFRTHLVEDIVRFAKLLKGAKAFLGNDSGFTHLAGYLGVKTAALFGPTDPAVWRPLGKRVKVFYRAWACSPCFPVDCTRIPRKGCLLFPPGEIADWLLR